jgi:3-oxoacyl-[acyl-carrier protein] reductase
MIRLTSPQRGGIVSPGSARAVNVERIVTVPYRYEGLDGRVAVVTGASQNLGAAMATALADQGCKVAVVGRSNRAGAEAVADRIVDAGGTAGAWCADLTKQDQVTTLFAEIVDRLGPVEILVNNAGGWKKPAPIWELTLESWREILSDNLDSILLCTQAVLPSMMERRWGRIVNLSSVAGRTGRTNGEASYATAKGGVISLTRQMAAELGPYGINVNAVAPGTTLKERGRKRTQEYYDALAQKVTLRRLGEPFDQAAAVCFLVSVAADWVTGVTLDVDGGQMLG